MKIPVTGRCSFVSAAAAHLAVTTGHVVANLDALTYAAGSASEDWWRSLQTRDGVGRQLGTG